MKFASLAACAGVVVLAIAQLTETPKYDAEQERAQDAQISALYACARNEAYAQSGWMEQPMLEQCIDDWFDANPGVDY
jgi:hypothetical protein